MAGEEIVAEAQGGVTIADLVAAMNNMTTQLTAKIDGVETRMQALEQGGAPLVPGDTGSSTILPEQFNEVARRQRMREEAARNAHAMGIPLVPRVQNPILSDPHIQVQIPPMRARRNLLSVDEDVEVQDLE